MKEKIFDFGTTHPVIVESASKSLITVIAEDINEGFFLLGHNLKTLPNKGDKGTIVFERGGVMKGFWQYYPDLINNK